MAGHSKWANIKYRKSAIDAKRGKIFSKIAKEITVSVKESGTDPAMNSRLKLALSKAKESNMPSKNIENAIKRGTGEIKGGDIISVVYEGYGPCGVAIIIECLTDNKNRTIKDVKLAFSKNEGNFGESGSVAWQFEKKGIIVLERSKIKSEEALMEKSMDWGCEDFLVDGEAYIIYTHPHDLEKILENFKAENIEILESEINYVPKNTIELSVEDGEKVQMLLDSIEEIDDVQLVASNEKVVS